MKYCSDCGAPTSDLIPPGDNRLRSVCQPCGVVHYRNPRMVVGTVPYWGNQVLLCRRAIAPRLGYWTLPAGFMEVGETTQAGAMRETREEAGANVELESLFAMLDVPHVEQVHLFFSARLLDLNFFAGEESLEVRLFSPQDIPWNELAFQTVARTLGWFLADHQDGALGLHVDTVSVPVGQERMS